MTIYLATVVATILLQLLRATVGTTDDGPRRTSAVQWGIDCVCILVLAAAPGFRAWHVGTDTIMYVSMYDTTIDTASWSNTTEQSIVEPGFALWQFIWSLLGLSTRWFLVVTALVTNGLQYGAIRMIAPRMLPAISAYSLSGFYLFQFNGMRQALAISIFVFGMALILRGRRRGWVLLVLAALVHQSTLIALPAFILAHRYRRRTTFNTRIVLLCGGVVLGLLLVSAALAAFLTDLVGDKYGAYAGASCISPSCSWSSGSSSPRGSPTSSTAHPASTPSAWARRWWVSSSPSSTGSPSTSRRACQCSSLPCSPTDRGPVTQYCGSASSRTSSSVSPVMETFSPTSGPRHNDQRSRRAGPHDPHHPPSSSAPAPVQFGPCRSPPAFANIHRHLSTSVRPCQSPPITAGHCQHRGDAR